jgi:hypothetical protein
VDVNAYATTWQVFSSARRLSLEGVVGLNKEGPEHCQVSGPRELYTLAPFSGMTILAETLQRAR